MRRNGERLRRARDATGVRPDVREPVVNVALRYQEDADLELLAA